jgi:protein SCO1/2
MNPNRIRFSLALACFALTLNTPADEARTTDHDYDAPKPGSYTLPIVKRAADGEVLDAKGEALRLRQFTQGRVTVMSFIYTRCAAAKACPMATGVLMQLRRISAEDPALAKNLRLVSMSFDPGGDTPKRMADYADLMRGENPGADWHFLTTRSQAQLRPILDAYGQAVDRKENRSDPTGPLNHTLRVFLIDRAGNIRNIYSSGTLDVRLVLADVKTLLLESSPSQPPLTPAQAARKAGESCTVAFTVESTACVTDITDRDNQRPLEVLLTDARNDDSVAPTERAGIIVRIPVLALKAFDAADMNELAQRFQGRNVLVTSKVESEPHPLRHDSKGDNLPRPRITITDPNQIRIENTLPPENKQMTANNGPFHP